jgi:glycosyltransferase involved in cell wall biosynthesis
MNQEAVCEVGFTEVSDPAVMALVPVVSVHMITYNHGMYLAEAIEGVISQKTNFPIELVIGEDCSLDNTKEIALDYQQRYPHLIRVIYSGFNVGMNANFSRVSKACRGEFIAICEGDDYWIDPQKLMEQVALLSKLEAIDICFHSCYTNQGKQNKNFISHVRSLSNGVIPMSDVIAGDGDFMPTASIIIHRSLLMSIQNWLDTTSPPVIDYFLQVFGSRRGGSYYINKPMCMYRKNVQGSWTETTKKLDALVAFEQNFYSSVKKLEDEIPGYKDAYNLLIAYHYSCLFTKATEENVNQILEVILPIIKERYESDALMDDGNASRQLDLWYLLKLAADCGNIKARIELKCGVCWQFLRVSRSFRDYGITILRMMNSKQLKSNEFERTIAMWNKEVEKSYLNARWHRLRELIFGLN